MDSANQQMAGMGSKGEQDQILRWKGGKDYRARYTQGEGGKKRIYVTRWKVVNVRRVCKAKETEMEVKVCST